MSFEKSICWSRDFVAADSLLLTILSIDGQAVYAVFGARNLSLHCLCTWFGAAIEKLLLRKASVFCEILNSFTPPTPAMFSSSSSSSKTGMNEKSGSSVAGLSPHPGLRVVEPYSKGVCTSRSSGVRHTSEVTLGVEEFKATLRVEEFEVPFCGVEASEVTLCVCEDGTLCALVASRLLTRSVMLCMSPLRLPSIART